MRLLYSFIWWLLLPLVLLRLWRRGNKEPGYRAHVAERLGFYSQDARLSDPQGRFIWVHAVSVGETRAAEPLINALLAQYPQHSVLLTCMTATGRATGAQVFGRHGMRVVQSFLPYDTGWMCARFLRHFRPAVCVLMETEVWPNLIEQCRRHQVPIMLANARLSERSLRRGRRFGTLLRPAAAAIDVVAAQSVADAERLRAFGARRVEVTGSLKFDVQPPVEMVERGLAWKQAIGQRRILLCASTREGEEALILDALVTLGCTDWLTVIVPRHPQRFDEVATMIQSRALRMRRRTQLEQDGRWDEVDVMLGDSMGEMFAYYALCDVAFVGGSLLPLGGQNLIEALALGKPVLVGEYTFNFGSITEEAVRDGAAHRVEDAPALLGHWLSLMDDPQRMSRMSHAALSYGLHHQGATLRSLALLAPLLQEPQSAQR